MKELILYTSVDGNVKVEVTYSEGSFWLSQRAMITIFGVEVPAINKHLTHIYETKELNKEATISKMEIVQMEGNRKVNRKIDCKARYSAYNGKLG